MLLEPAEHAVSNSCGLTVRAGDRVLVERVPDLVQRRRDREPDEQSDRPADDEEVEEDRDRLGDVVPAEPFDAGPDRSRERERQEQKDEDAPHLPDAEGERDRRRARRRSPSPRGRSSRGRPSCRCVPAVSERRSSDRREGGVSRRALRNDAPGVEQSSVTSAPKAKPPMCAKKATPPPFADAEVRPACPSTSW